MSAALVTIIVQAINALATLAPQVVNLVQMIRSHPDLTAGGKALLDSDAAILRADDARAQATQPLPAPQETTKPGP